MIQLKELAKILMSSVESRKPVGNSPEPCVGSSMKNTDRHGRICGGSICGTVQGYPPYLEGIVRRIC